MKLHSSADTVAWCMRYVGLPITLGITMYGLCSHFSQKKRRAALEGKVIVITGASSGIGEALAHAFHEHGSKVVLAARRKTELERVKQDLMSKNLSHPTLEPVVLEVDLADLDSLSGFVERVHARCGPIDVLVNNGGVSHRGSILHTAIDVDKQIMFINYFGSVALTKAVLPMMVKRRSGHILFVSSVQGLIAIPDRSAYAATKHALQAFGDCLRAEMRQHGVRVSVVSPGYIRTNISINAYTGSGDPHGVMDTSTAAGFPAEYAAARILDAVVYNKHELIISQFVPRLAIFLRHAAPSLYFWLMNKRAAKTTLPE